MEETKKSPNFHGGNKKMVIKARGGGAGAAVMFGGALVTAALFSAFAVRQKRRSSGEDSSPEINEKNESEIISEGEEELELGKNSAVVSSDQSFKLEDEGKVETDEENDAVSDSGLIFINEKIPFLGEKLNVELVKEDVPNNHSKEEVIVVEEVLQNDQTIQFEGFCYDNEEINKKKCEEETSLTLLESPIQEDVLVDEQVIGAKFSSLQFDGKKIIKNEDESKCEALWETESTHQVKLMKYEVGGKIEEDDNMMNKKDEQEDSSTMRVMTIWVMCVLASLSCSWFFGLSSVKMGLVMFLTVFLLEIYGFSVLNHQHDYEVKGRS